MKGIIYKYTNKLNGHSYIGQTINPKTRIIGHRNSKRNDYFHRAIRKYGFENFEYEVLYEFDLPKELLKATLNIMEIRMIESLSPEYNLTKGGEGTVGRACSEETKNKIGNANRGKVRTEEQRKKISLGHIGNKVRLGKKHSEETKQKMREAHKRRKQLLYEN